MHIQTRAHAHNAKALQRMLWASPPVKAVDALEWCNVYFKLTAQVKGMLGNTSHNIISFKKNPALGCPQTLISMKAFWEENTRKSPSLFSLPIHQQLRASICERSNMAGAGGSWDTFWQRLANGWLQSSPPRRPSSPLGSRFHAATEGRTPWRHPHPPLPIPSSFPHPAHSGTFQQNIGTQRRRRCSFVEPADLVRILVVSRVLIPPPCLLDSENPARTFPDKNEGRGYGAGGDEGGAGCG